MGDRTIHVFYKLSLTDDDGDYTPIFFDREEAYRGADSILFQVEGLVSSLSRMFPEEFFTIEYCVQWYNNGKDTTVDISIDVTQIDESEVKYVLTDKGRQVLLEASQC